MLCRLRIPAEWWSTFPKTFRGDGNPYLTINMNRCCFFPSKIEGDLTNGPLSKLLELLDTQV